MARTGVRCA